MIKYDNQDINNIIFKKSIIKPDKIFLEKIQKLKDELKNIKFDQNIDNKNYNNKNNDNTNIVNESKF